MLGQEQQNTTVAGNSPQFGRAAVVERVNQLGIVWGIFSLTSFMLVYYYEITQWQVLIGAGGAVVSLLCIAVALWLSHRGKLNASGYLVLFAMLAIYGLGELARGSGTFFNFAVGALIIILLATVIWLDNWRVGLVPAGLYVVCLLLINQFKPFPDYSRAESIVLSIFDWAGAGLVVALVLWLIFLTFRIGTIRTRMLVTSVSLVLLVAVSVSASSIIISFRSGQQQVSDRLEVVAALKETKVKTWARDLQTDLGVLLIQEEALIRMRWLLQPSAFRELNENLLLEDFKQTMELTQRFDEMFLLDLEGQVVVSTDPTQKGKDYSQKIYFQNGLAGPYLQPPFYSPRLRHVSMVVARPVYHQKGPVLGVLAGRANMSGLNEIMLDRAGVGKSGGTYLVDPFNVLLSVSSFSGYEVGETEVHSEGLEAALAAKTAGRIDGPELYNDYRGEPVIGVYHWLPELQVVLLAEQNQSEAFDPIFTTLRSNVIIALAAVLVAVVVGLFLTRSIANPLAELAGTATNIAAGDLDLVVNVVREDEIGNLATAFNSMTAQLHDLIHSLEQRVVDRTHRLEIVATLSERLGAILNLEELLPQVVQQVQDNFGYYHAHIYLLDDDRERLVVAAGTGLAGAEMKTRGHNISMDATTSLVARAARAAQIVRVDNVREARDWLPNELLPNTYSEMAVPIVLAGQVVGVLDVQQDRIAGLDEGDANLLRSLANQVAVAIRNARLFNEVETSLTKAHELQQRYIEQGWNIVEVARQGVRRVQFSLGKLNPVDDAVIAKAKQEALANNELAIVALDGSEPESAEVAGLDASPHATVAPITLHNTPIGTLQLHGVEGNKKWTEGELAIINAVIDQVPQVAESLRLLNVTQSRAAREQLTRQITDKIRSTSNVEEILKTTVAELSRELGRSLTFIDLHLDKNNQK